MGSLYIMLLSNPLRRTGKSLCVWYWFIFLIPILLPKTTATHSENIIDNKIRSAQTAFGEFPSLWWISVSTLPQPGKFLCCLIMWTRDSCWLQTSSPVISLPHQKFSSYCYFQHRNCFRLGSAWIIIMYQLGYSPVSWRSDYQHAFQNQVIPKALWILWP